MRKQGSINEKISGKEEILDSEEISQGVTEDKVKKQVTFKKKI